MLKSKPTFATTNCGLKGRTFLGTCALWPNGLITQAPEQLGELCIAVLHARIKATPRATLGFRGAARCSHVRQHRLWDPGVLLELDRKSSMHDSEAVASIFFSTVHPLNLLSSHAGTPSKRTRRRRSCTLADRRSTGFSVPARACLAQDLKASP